MEDVRIGRKSRASQGNVTITTTGVEFVGHNPNRIALIINAPPTNAVTLSLLATPVLEQGIVLRAANEPLHLDIQRHGQLVCGPIRAISATADQRLDYWEVTLSEK